MALTPTLTIVDTTATVSDGENEFINYLVVTKNFEKWVSIGSRVGNGDIVITGLPPGNYFARVMSTGSPGTVSDFVPFSVAGMPLRGINPNWGRWIYASICSHFEDHRGNLFMFLEGEHRETQNYPEFFELRVDGPFYTQNQRGWWNLIVEVNAICTVAISDKDFHGIRRVTDFVASLFVNEIPVYRFGNGILDDGTYLGCLTSMDGYRRRLQISHFGQLQPADGVLQSAVERHYHMTLEE